MGKKISVFRKDDVEYLKRYLLEAVREVLLERDEGGYFAEADDEFRRQLERQNTILLLTPGAGSQPERAEQYLVYGAIHADDISGKEVFISAGAEHDAEKLGYKDTNAEELNRLRLKGGSASLVKGAKGDEDEYAKKAIKIGQEIAKAWAAAGAPAITESNTKVSGADKGKPSALYTDEKGKSTANMTSVTDIEIGGKRLSVKAADNFQTTLIESSTQSKVFDTAYERYRADGSDPIAEAMTTAGTESISPEQINQLLTGILKSYETEKGQGVARSEEDTAAINYLLGMRQADVAKGDAGKKKERELEAALERLRKSKLKKAKKAGKEGELALDDEGRPALSDEEMEKIQQKIERTWDEPAEGEKGPTKSQKRKKAKWESEKQVLDAASGELETAAADYLGLDGVAANPGITEAVIKTTTALMDDPKFRGYVLRELVTGEGKFKKGDPAVPDGFLFFDPDKEPANAFEIMSVNAYVEHAVERIKEGGYEWRISAGKGFKGSLSQDQKDLRDLQGDKFVDPRGKRPGLVRTNPEAVPTKGQVTGVTKEGLIITEGAIWDMVKSTAKSVAAGAKKYMGSIFKKLKSMLTAGASKLFSALGLEGMFDGLSVDVPPPELTGKVTWEE